MNKNLLTTLVALLFVCATLNAQVKDQYQDKSNGTTIVVKEDAANDMDILNDQFDLDDVGMHQVIRITTREEIPAEPSPEVVTEAKPEVKAPTANTVVSPPTETLVLATSAELTPKGISQTPTISTVKTVTETTVESNQVATTSNVPEKNAESSAVVTRAPSSAKRSSSYASGKKSGSSHKFKVFNKRFKKQKRKRVPRKRKRNKRCYRF